MDGVAHSHFSPLGLKGSVVEIRIPAHERSHAVGVRGFFLCEGTIN